MSDTIALRARAAVLLLLGGLTAPPAILHAQSIIRTGKEFQVNVYTNASENRPSLDFDADGDFVVIWNAVRDGSVNSVTARRFDSAGVGQAAEFQVNTYTAADQKEPDVAMAASGAFVVAWASENQDGGLDGIFARRFDASGVAQASEFQVNTFTSGTQGEPDVDMDAAGDFVVTWHSNLQDGSTYGIFARRFDATGTTQAAEFQVNSHTASQQFQPAVALDGDGDFVVTWTSLNQDGSATGVFAQRFDSAGSAVAAEFQVNDFTPSSQRYGSVASAADGDFVVSWTSYLQDGAGEGVFVRRFDSAGIPLGVEMQVNTFTGYTEWRSSVAINADGGFVVAWEGAGQDGPVAYTGIFARDFNAIGVPQGVELQVNSYTGGNQRRPVVALGNDGDFVVAWHSYHDGFNTGIFAQRFAPIAVLDVDANGSASPLTDGLLILRYQFGFRGAVLTSGAVDLVNCNRCDAAAIEAYLESVN